MSVLVRKVGNIQQIRTIHALAESGIEVVMNAEEVAKLSTIQSNFDIHFGQPTPDAIPFEELVMINHAQPRVKIGSIDNTLIFPKGLFEWCENHKCENKPRLLFFGLVTPQRQQVLYTLKDVHVLNSARGRIFPIKAFDENYFSTVKSAQFTLCLDGDFIWTYRFFEACMCRSIPVIQNMCASYEGFKFYTINQYNNEHPEYNEEWAEYNFNLAMERLTVNSLTLQKEIGLLCLL